MEYNKQNCELTVRLPNRQQCGAHWATRDIVNTIILCRVIKLIVSVLRYHTSVLWELKIIHKRFNILPIIN